MKTIGSRPNSFVRTYFIEEINREVSRIHFYNDNGIIATSDRAWLSANPEFRDVSLFDIQDIKITKELKTHKANYNLEKATADKCHFTINNVKKSNWDDPSCDLYLYVSSDEDTEADFKFVSSKEYRDLNGYSRDFTATLMHFNHVTIKALHGGKCRALDPKEVENIYINDHTHNEKIELEKEGKLLDEACDIISSLGIYMDKAEIGKILNAFELVKRDKTLLEQGLEHVKADERRLY